MSVLAAHQSSATNRQLVVLLNRLLEAERAGAQVLREFRKEYEVGSKANLDLQAIQGDEAANCAVLVDLIRQLNAHPSLETGAFLDKALAVQGKAERLEYLNRGQEWVVRKIREALSLAPDAHAADALQKMLESHVRNIRDCERLINEVRSHERN